MSVTSDPLEARRRDLNRLMLALLHADGVLQRLEVLDRELAGSDRRAAASIWQERGRALAEASESIQVAIEHGDRLLAGLDRDRAILVVDERWDGAPGAPAMSRGAKRSTGRRQPRGRGRRTTTIHVRRMAAGGVTAVLLLLLALLAMLLTPLPELFGRQVLAVYGGSMAPAIPVGSVIVVRPVPAGALQQGDVITFYDATGPRLLVTHRVVGFEWRDGQQVAVTKGDANSVVDAWAVPIDRPLGRVEWHMPFLGYVIMYLSTPVARLTALALAIVLVALPAVLRRGRAASCTRHTPAAGSGPFEALARDIDRLARQAAGTPGAPRG